MKAQYTIGLDYGTDSVRALIVNAANGKAVASEVFHYPRWKKGLYCDPSKNRFRQHPLDYIEGLEISIKKALRKAGKHVANNVKAISIDTTGSTPVAVNKEGMPLSLLPAFNNNPNAMFVLWKDHTAVQEADDINKLAKSWGGIDYTKYEGGIYSSEWFWAKILHILRNDAKVREAAFSWVEHCDWIPAVLCGNSNPLTLKRSRCAAGHKAMWHEEWGGLPSEDFLQQLDPLLIGIRERLFTKTYTCDVAMGTISEAWAKKLGLPKDVVIGTGAFDAHLGAVGAEIEAYHLCKVMGTSTCDMLIAPHAVMQGKLIKGICGQVDGSIVPGMLGMEAGQSAFGDIYAWYRKMLLWPLEHIEINTKILSKSKHKQLINDIEAKVIPTLSKAAQKIAVSESAVIALDWMNGRRTPDTNQLVQGAIAGLSLGSDAPRIFRALVEATAFGAKRITDRFISEGVRIDGIIALGGVAKKSAFVMQIVADVLNMPIKVARSEQACALGAAMAAAVAGGIYPSIEKTQKAMGNGFEKQYRPNKANAEKYQALYETYCRLGNFVEKELT